MSLVERITELQIRQVPLDTFANAITPLLLDALDTPAGALLLYHAESEALELIGSRGLSAAGLRHLEKLRRGAADSWEIPLHGLMNRKAYIIERPDDHPFVPELVSREVVPRAANLASIPLYRGPLPVGVLLAIADRRAIGEREIFAYVLAFDALALALDGYVRARAWTSPSIADGAADVAPASTAESAVACEPWVDPGELASRLETERGGEQAAGDALAARLAETERRLAAAHAAIERATANRVTLVADADAQRRSALVAEQQRAEHEIDEMRDMLAAREREMQAARDHVETALRTAETTHEAELGSLRATHEAELRAATAARDATIADGERALAAIRAEHERTCAALTDERDHARVAAAEAGGLVRQLRSTVDAAARERDDLRSAHAEASARRDAALTDASRLGDEAAELRAEVGRLREERARVIAAVDEPGAEPALVIRALHEKVASLESEIAAHAAERAEVARRAASQAEQLAQQLAAQHREVDELRSAHERSVAEMRAAHARGLDDLRVGGERALAAAIGEQERVRADRDTQHEAALAALRSAHAEELTRAATERDARRHEVEGLATQCDDLEGRLAWALAEREEAAAAAAVRERAALARLEAARRDVLAERARLADERDAAERARLDAVRRMTALEEDVVARDERATALQRELEEQVAQLSAARTEIARLEEDRERVLAVVDDPGTEPAAVIQALRERVASFEAQVRGIDEERAQAATRAASDAEQAEHRVALVRRELAEARAQHRAALEEAQTTARRELEAAVAEQRREREADATAHREEIAASRDAAERVDAERRSAIGHLERDRDAALAGVRALRAVVTEREASLRDRDDALADVGAARARVEEVAATTAAELASIRKAGAALATERDALQARVETLVAADAERAAQLAALRQERASEQAARVQSESRAEQLATELAVIQAEALRLREDRARVLAAVDDESAEPAAVVRALRERLAGVEGQLEAYAAERAELGRRAAAEARAAEERLAIVRAERDAAESEYRREREAAEAERQRDRELADAEHAREREVIEAERRRERGAVEAEHRREFETLRAAHARTVEETVSEHRRLVEEIARAHRSELAELATAHERALTERGAEITRLDSERRAMLKQAETLRAVLAAAQARDAAQRARGAGAALSIATPPHATTPIAGDRAAGAHDVGTQSFETAASSTSSATSTDESAAPAISSTPTIEVVQRDGHHILESDAARWELIYAALSAALPPTAGRSLMIANLLAAFPSRLYDLTAAATAGTTLVAYAADAHDRSCILGAVRCFVDPPTAAEAAAVLEAMPRGTRRVLTLSEDVEAFLEAKIGLAKAGHSVSMACDAKQAIDLLGMLTPDAVFVDVRTAPTAASEFLSALAPESGRVVVVLVHGDPAGNLLPCVIQRLLRPAPLDPAALVETCRAVLAGPPSAVARTAPVKAIRPFERPKPALPRKPLARRLIPRRR
ncbi:MAG: hypothetical protein E6J72_15865 [Deltaproteobacteria bacterium]|nr:MAG: hypothetical protein E6J72_15865 [Deltaproteobacteria bacterium]